MKVLVYGKPKNAIGIEHWFGMELDSTEENSSEEIMSEVYQNGATHVFSVKLPSGKIVRHS